MVGLVDGDFVGLVGLCVPVKVPLLDGDAEGDKDGLVDGEVLEGFVGDDDNGAMLGLFDGELVGLVDGGFIRAVGLGVPGEVTLTDGESEGCADGLVDGINVGTDEGDFVLECLEGDADGDVVGAADGSRVAGFFVGMLVSPPIMTGALVGAGGRAT